MTSTIHMLEEAQRIATLQYSVASVPISVAMETTSDRLAVQLKECDNHAQAECVRIEQCSNQYIKRILWKGLVDTLVLRLHVQQRLTTLMYTSALKAPLHVPTLQAQSTAPPPPQTPQVAQRAPLPPRASKTRPTLAKPGASWVCSSCGGKGHTRRSPTCPSNTATNPKPTSASAATTPAAKRQRIDTRGKSGGNSGGNPLSDSNAAEMLLSLTT